MNSNTVSNTVDSIFIVLGTTYGIKEIETIFGIVLLSFQILWIMSKLGYALYTKIKKKDYDFSGTIKDTIDDIKDLKDSITNNEEEQQKKDGEVDECNK